MASRQRSFFDQQVKVTFIWHVFAQADERRATKDQYPPMMLGDGESLRDQTNPAPRAPVNTIPLTPSSTSRNRLRGFPIQRQ